jgi:hypothetical protein
VPLRVRNFTKFQHYSKRMPPWIKLHRGVLHDYAFTCLQDASKAHAMLLWLLASTCDNAIPDDAQWIARQIHATSPVDIEALVSAGFLERYGDEKRKHRASKRLAPRKQNGGTEGETEGEGETEKKLLAADSQKRESGPSAAAPRTTWLTPIGDVWDADNGKGSFPYPQAARELKPLRDAGHTPETIAEHLAWYLRVRGLDTLDPDPDVIARTRFTPSLRDFRLRFAKFNPRRAA